MTSSQPATDPQETMTRMVMMQHGSLVITALSLGAGVVLLVLAASGAKLPLMYGGLHLMNFGGTMAVAAGALNGHRAMIRNEIRTQQMLSRYDKRIEDRLKRLQQIEDGILSAVADDDLTHRRRGGHN